MAISFDAIPTHLRVPGVYTEIDNTRAVAGPQLLRLSVLLIGQTLGSGTAAPLVPVRVTSLAQAHTLFGNGSMLATMVEAALAANAVSELWCQPLVDAASGLQATGALIFGGTPTQAGSVTLYIGGKPVQIGATTGQTPAVLASALAAAVNANPTLEVTAATDGADPAKVVFTARHKGFAGNTIGLHLGYFGEVLPKGLTATLVAMAGGDTNPDIAPALAALGDAWVQCWAVPYTDSATLTLVENELADRFGPAREIEGQAFAAVAASHSALGTLGNLRNSPHVSLVAAYGEPMPVYAKAAETAAIAAYYASLDPARPLQTLPYRYCLPPPEKVRFTREERNLLLFDGIATTHVDAGGVMRVERLITTYKTNAAGAPDTSYLDVEPMFTLMTIRHDWKDYILRKYPRHKLADDGTRFALGQAVMTPNLAKAEAMVKLREWEAAGLVENVDAMKDQVLAERDATDPNRLNVLMPPDLINGLRVLATSIQFRL